MSLFTIFKTFADIIKNNSANSDQQLPQEKQEVGVKQPVANQEQGSNSVYKPGNSVFPDYGYRVGELTKKYETSNRGPGYISAGNTWGDPGGISYGSYQLETEQGTMQGYLNSTPDRFKQALRPLKINSDSFKVKWRQLAQEDPVGFEQSQFDYLAHKPGGYYAALEYAKQIGWNVYNIAMQAAIFSTVNQSGGWKEGIFNKAGIKSSDDLKTQINKLYDARANYFRRIKLKQTVRDNIILNRTDENRDGSRSKLDNERDDALRMADDA